MWSQLSRKQKLLFTVNMGGKKELHVDDPKVERHYNTTPGKLIADFLENKSIRCTTEHSNCIWNWG